MSACLVLFIFFLGEVCIKSVYLSTQTSEGPCLLLRLSNETRGTTAMLMLSHRRSPQPLLAHSRNSIHT